MLFLQPTQSYIAPRMALQKPSPQRITAMRPYLRIRLDHFLKKRILYRKMCASGAHAKYSKSYIAFGGSLFFTGFR
jgi:hypothetical protein